MKPTQEQIEAALQRITENWISADQCVLIFDYAQICNDDTHCTIDCNDRKICAYILAAAYRELREENNRLKPWADLAITSNALLAIEKSKKA
jgi:hypothetical protein